jgi:hypothetical protein
MKHPYNELQQNPRLKGALDEKVLHDSGGGPVPG